MVISTGMADDEEIEEAAQAARDGGCTDFVLLHCVSGYPAPAADYNLATIPDMARRWEVPVGLSDHTLTTPRLSPVWHWVPRSSKSTLRWIAQTEAQTTAFRWSREFSELCMGARSAWQAVGRVDYGCKSSEVGNVIFRRRCTL